MDPDKALHASEAWQILSQALSLEEFGVVRALYVEGYTLEEYANEVGISKVTAARRSRSAMARLRALPHLRDVLREAVKQADQSPVRPARRRDGALGKRKPVGWAAQPDTEDRLLAQHTHSLTSVWPPWVLAELRKIAKGDK